MRTIKSQSFKWTVSDIAILLCERCLSWYCKKVRSGRNVCRTCWLFLSMPAKKILSVSSKISVIDGSSFSQNPGRLHRLSNPSNRARSAAEHCSRNTQANSRPTGFSQGSSTEKRGWTKGCGWTPAVCPTIVQNLFGSLVVWVTKCQQET